MPDEWTCLTSNFGNNTSMEEEVDVMAMAVDGDAIRTPSPYLNHQLSLCGEMSWHIKDRWPSKALRQSLQELLEGS